MFAAMLVSLLIYMAFKYEPSDMPGLGYVVSFTLAEGMMMVSAIGIITSVKIARKTRLVMMLRYLNIAILAASGLVGFNTFMQMAA